MAGKLGLKVTAGALVLAIIAAASSVFSSADTLSDYQKRQKELARIRRLGRSSGLDSATWLLLDLLSFLVLKIPDVPSSR